MTTLRQRWGEVTEGERARAAAYGLVAVIGAVMSFLVIQRLDADVRGPLHPLTFYEFWQIAAGAIGAAAALRLSGEMFGQPGLRGWKSAAMGVLFVSFVGALIAGTLVLPLYGTMFGPFSLAVALAGSPILALAWVSHLFGAHWLMRRWRDERDSIFRHESAEPREPAPAAVIVETTPRPPPPPPRPELPADLAIYADPR
ncbi:methionine sulfoxide reductase B [Oceanicola granulosus HTCC2516]|uniref:Methionine sulfoxide reductase B n=1 Tax=Oceanicola granulosus (strain ATCC BAA-861 / DSM 15982 / KCTC 12143 / HTCC2516) TaxID=314256 RepID=Q2CIG5_OCEGH|nr:hypothetical protein [Oceanicola granulosus]EAR52624.1 methionine sulfoxide reductase B [Oceanicola granulosus HTCC2516]